MAPATAEAELRGLIDEYRARCLWSLREDYYPTTRSERERVLRLIERHGDSHVLRRVAALRACLSPHFNATSAGS